MTHCPCGPYPLYPIPPVPHRLHTLVPHCPYPLYPIPPVTLLPMWPIPPVPHVLYGLWGQWGTGGMGYRGYRPMGDWDIIAHSIIITEWILTKILLDIDIDVFYLNTGRFLHDGLNSSIFRWILNSVCSLLGALLLAQIASLYIHTKCACADSLGKYRV